MTSKERTADFTDFADGGDAAQGSGWRGKVARPGQHHPCRRALRLFLIRAIRVIRVIRGYIHPLGAATSRRHCPPRNPKLSGTRRPSPHPDPQLPRGRRRLVAVVPQRGRMTAQIESGAAWSRPVLRPSAWSAGPLPPMQPGRSPNPPRTQASGRARAWEGEARGSPRSAVSAPRSETRRGVLSSCSQAVRQSRRPVVVLSRRPMVGQSAGPRVHLPRFHPSSFLPALLPPKPLAVGGGNSATAGVAACRWAKTTRASASPICRPIPAGHPQGFTVLPGSCANLVERL